MTDEIAARGITFVLRGGSGTVNGVPYVLGLIGSCEPIGGPVRPSQCDRRVGERLKGEVEVGIAPAARDPLDGARGRQLDDSHLTAVETVDADAV